jgi:hypothetical protein
MGQESDTIKNKIKIQDKNDKNKIKENGGNKRK